MRSFVVAVPLVVFLAACATHAPAPHAAARSASVADPAVEAPPAESNGQDGDDVAAKASPTPTPRNAAGFADWVAGFRARAAARGVDATTLNAAFDDAEYLPRVVELDNRQPEFNRAIWDYLDTAVSATRVTNGRAKLAAHRSAADDAERRYGVPGNIITAIWGMESNYGANFGHYETIDALATLGYDGRRQSFAENQLYAAMKILSNGDIPRDRMRGSWAGAMGNTQFIPTSFVAYAVDADGDGRRDIWGSIPDTMASTANYLAKNGWRAGQSWGREVRLPADFDYSQADGDTRQSSAAWATAGVRPIDDRSLPDLANAGILAPAGAAGPAFMVGHNYRVILRYNNATAYALGVALLSDRIDGEPGVQAAWPRDTAVLSNSQTRALQRQLNALGYGAGTPDGIMGPNTRSALRRFQRDRGLPADGFATQDLLQAVTEAAGRTY
ncbi:lytic murein transglycosylase [Salinisphaera sp. Q1T1-3]|uniref:lytic murein transglycosylase n=1 Tax=Salinisphaera sp. Q1T1-3 TaxID=2321229 RepID=UPI001F2DB64F|nr:lytic murein transglycosylase [Salinisphaera sp. Q1T1-3]